MRLKSETVQRTSRFVLFCLVIIEVSFALIYFISFLQLGTPLASFNFDRRWTIPVVFSACELFLIGFFLLIAACLRSRESQKPSPWFLFVLGLGFLDLFIEKLFKWHDGILNELLHSLPWMPQFKSGAGSWVFIYVPLGIIILLAGYRDLIALWRLYPKATLITALGIGISFLGGVLLEIIHYQFLAIKFAQMERHHAPMVRIMEIGKVTIEEFLEMLGESIALYGLSWFWVKKLERSKSRLHQFQTDELHTEE